MASERGEATPRSKKKRLRLFSKKSSRPSSSAPSVVRSPSTRSTAKKSREQTKEEDIEVFPGIVLHTASEWSAFPGIPLRESLLSSTHLQCSRVHLPSLASASSQPSPKLAPVSAPPSEPDDLSLDLQNPPPPSPISPNAGYRSRLSIFGLFSPAPSGLSSSQSNGDGVTESGSLALSSAAILEPPSPRPLSASSSSSSSSSSSQEEEEALLDAGSGEELQLQDVGVDELIVMIIPEVNQLFALMEVEENERLVSSRVGRLTSMCRRLAAAVDQRFHVANYMDWLLLLITELSELCQGTTKAPQRAKRFVDLQNQLAASFGRLLALPGTSESLGL